MFTLCSCDPLPAQLSAKAVALSAGGEEHLRHGMAPQAGVPAARLPAQCSSRLLPTPQPPLGQPFAQRREAPLYAGRWNLMPMPEVVRASRG